MKKIYFAFLLCSMTMIFTAKAQVVNTNQATDINERLKKFEGTYQLQVINTREKPFIPGNLDAIIEKNRDKNKIIYVSLGTHVRVKILPENEIQKSNFKKLDQITYIQD